ncbi:MAG: hypothetical protein ACSLFR_16215 [Solirubrobacteraceae bacterium]
MLSHALFILVLWGPVSIWEWKRNSYFPFVAGMYAALFLAGLWIALVSGNQRIDIPFAAGAYVLYAITGAFFWIREDGNPRLAYFDWREALRKPK